MSIVAALFLLRGWPALLMLIGAFLWLLVRLEDYAVSAGWASSTAPWQTELGLDGQAHPLLRDW